MKVVSVEEEYKKFQDLKKDEVLKILEWVKTQPHLPEMIEREIILFHFACHNSVEATKRTIDHYFTIRTHCPEFFSKMDIMSNEMKLMMNVLTVVPIRNKSTPEHYQVIVAKLEDPNPANFNLNDCLKLYCMIFGLSLLQEGIQEGHVLVMDMSGCTLGHLTRLNPITMKKFLTFLQEGAPIRLKALHYINIVPFMDKFLAIIKPFMKQELLNMLHVHSTLDDFYKFVPKDVLPQEYGGTNGTMKTFRDETYKDLIESQQYFIDEEKTHRVNEKLRPGKPKTASDLFGAEGNFKKLDFD